MYYKKKKKMVTKIPYMKAVETAIGGAVLLETTKLIK